MYTAEKLLAEAAEVLVPVREAATVKSKLQGLLKAAEELLADRKLPETVREEIKAMRTKLLKRWAELEESKTVTSNLLERGVLSEALPVKDRVPIVIIRAGQGNPKDKHYYPIDTLSRDYYLFEGKKMYVDHPTKMEEKERPERSLRDWVATVEDVTYNSAQDRVEGFATIHSDWFSQLVEKAPDGIGISINALGSTRKGEIYNQTWNIVDQLVTVNSVDFVTEAAAGGRIKALYESLRREEETSRMELKNLTLEQLKEGRADLVEAIRKEVNKTVEVDKELRGELTKLTEKNKILETKLVDVTTSLILREISEAAKTLVAASDLPAVAKERVTASLTGKVYITEKGEVDTAKLTEAVKTLVTAEKDYLAKIKESGRINHPSGSDTTGEQLKEARKAVWKQLGYDDATIVKMEKVKGG